MMGLEPESRLGSSKSSRVKVTSIVEPARPGTAGAAATARPGALMTVRATRAMNRASPPNSSESNK